MLKLHMNGFEWAAWVCTVIGAVNWGVYGTLKLDIVQAVFGTSPVLSAAAYVCIGLGGAYWAVRMLFFSTK